VDASVLEAFRRRESGAVRTLYREYGRLVYTVAHRVLGRHELAEEAAQQTFVRAWQAADRIDVDRDPAPWLATIAKRTAIDIYRREARRPTSALSDVAASDRAVVSLPSARVLNRPTCVVPRASRASRRVFTTIVGRRTYDMAHGWNGTAVHV
jgi:RNA polymerase sigma-70 factor (ECF subfamily)